MHGMSVPYIHINLLGVNSRYVTNIKVTYVNCINTQYVNHFLFWFLCKRAVAKFIVPEWGILLTPA